MANGEINATDLTEETTATLSGNEQFVMFDSAEGKRADIDEVATYIAGDKTQLQTTEKGSLVGAINEVNGKAADLKEDLNLLAEPSYLKIADKTARAADGYIDSTTGGTGGVGTWGYTKYISVAVFDSIYITMPTFSSANVGGIAFYDDDLHYISGVAGDVTGSQSYEMRYIKVPNNATLLRACYRYSYENYFLIYGGIKRYVYNNSIIERDITKVEKWEGGSLNYQGAEIGSAGYYRTKHIVCRPSSTLDIKVGSNAVFIFEYRSDGTFISTDSVTGGKKYTADAVHTLTSRTQKFRIVTRLEPVDSSAGPTIVDNIKVVSNFPSTQILEGEIAKVEAQITSSDNNNIGMQLFKTVGVISDSISCGWAKDKNGNNSRRNLDISWPQQMARRLGCTAFNLGASGVDPIEWFTPSYEFYQYCYPQYQSVGACDLYIIGLGLNGGTLGTIADINQSDYTQNAATFYGQYGRIVQMINAEHPASIVMCLTEPTTRITGYDQAVRDICALNFINAQLVDLENDYFDLFNTPEILAEHQPDGLHFTPYGYSLLAEAMVTAMNDYISKNSAAFKYVGVTTV